MKDFYCESTFVRGNFNHCSHQLTIIFLIETLQILIEILTELRESKKSAFQIMVLS